MSKWFIPGQGIVDDSDEGARIQEPGEITLPNGEKITWGIAGTRKLPEYENPAQYGHDRFQWDPTRQVMAGQIAETSPGYLTELLGNRQRVRSGQARDYEAEQYRQWEEQARAIPTRDIASLTAGWQGEREGQWGEGGWQAGNQDWWSRLDPGSPDVGPIMLQIQDRMEQGTATPQERQLFQQVYGMAADWNWRASVPQASDAFSPLGDNLMGALGTLALGATGGLAAAPLAAGGAGLTTTLGSLGTLAGVAGTGAGVLGQALDEPWLRNLGLGLSAAGGLAGGIGGLANVARSGVQSLADAARLAQSAGRITGALGRIPGAEALGQASRYLGLAGQLGQGASGAWDLFSGDGVSPQAVRSVLGGLGAAQTLGRTLLGRGRGGAPTGSMAPRPVTAQRAPALMAGNLPASTAPTASTVPAWQSTVPLLMQLARRAQTPR